MLATFVDYGVSADDGVQHRMGRRLLRWYASLGNEPRVTDEDVDNARYGGLAEMAAELVVRASPLETFASRRLANVGFAFLAFFAVLRIARRLHGRRAAFFALLSLALTPPFYGHSFFNSKDIPFAALYALAVGGILACDTWPGASWRSALGAGALIGLAAAVRVGGLVLFGFALVLWLATLLLGGAGRKPPRGALLRLLAAWSGALVVGWAVMVALWPWAMQDPLRNPFRAAGRFSSFWEGMLVHYDGRLLPAGQVSRYYLPNWLALTLPEHVFVALGLGLVGLALLVRARPLGPDARRRLLQAGWLASIPAIVVAGVVARRMPLYDGMRHFLFLVPLLAVLAGVSVSVFLRSPAGRPAKVAGVAVLAAASLLALVDMVRLHPYQSVYFNRLWAGGVKAGIERYEGDYWCLSYKEGCEWLLGRYAGARCREKIRVAGYSVLQQTQHYLEQTEEGRRLFRAVAVADGRPHFVMATTRFLDHLRAPGKPVYTVERMGATLFYLFEVRPPDCVHPRDAGLPGPEGPPALSTSAPGSTP